jgi:hypothetical protein
MHMDLDIRACDRARLARDQSAREISAVLEAGRQVFLPLASLPSFYAVALLPRRHAVWLPGYKATGLSGSIEQGCRAVISHAEGRSVQ